MRQTLFKRFALENGVFSNIYPNTYRKNKLTVKKRPSHAEMSRTFFLGLGIWALYSATKTLQSCTKLIPGLKSDKRCFNGWLWKIVHKNYIHKEQIDGSKHDHDMRKGPGQISWVTTLRGFIFCKENNPVLQNLVRIRVRQMLFKRLDFIFENVYDLYTERTNHRSKKRPFYRDFLLLLFLRKSFQPYIAVKKITQTDIMNLIITCFLLFLVR
jgi:hypothetical protein